MNCNKQSWTFQRLTFLLTNHQPQSSLQMANIVETAVGAGTFKTLVGNEIIWTIAFIGHMCKLQFQTIDIDLLQLLCLQMS